MSEGLFTRLLYHFTTWWDNAPPPAYMTTPHFAICLGHSRRINGHPEGGAVSHDGKINEWNFNLGVAIQARDILKPRGFRAVVISEYQGGGYDTAQRWLAGELKRLGVQRALELHFNSASPSATGHEWPYCKDSPKGKALAGFLDTRMAAAFPTLKRRGLKPRVPGSTRPDNRGWQFTWYPHCPSVICEPGFGSNPSDWQLLKENTATLATVYAEALIDSLQVPA